MGHLTTTNFDCGHTESKLIKKEKITLIKRPILFVFQLKYKRRVYKMLQMDEKQLKSINSKANHKKFVDHVTNGNVEKVNKMCTKGLDPNFHCQDSGGKN